MELFYTAKMKVLDYTVALLSISQIALDSDFIEVQLKSGGLTPDDDMDNGKEKSVKEVLYNLLPIILTSPKSITEGGYSISYDKDALLTFYRLLAAELDKPDLLDKQPKFKDITHLW